MTTKEDKVAKAIVKEYVNFIKKTANNVNDVKKVTAHALKKVMGLNDGDCILIKDDCSVDILPKGEDMADEKKEENAPEKITLNGREVTSEELERQKKISEKQEGVELKEVSKGNYRMRLND